MIKQLIQLFVFILFIVLLFFSFFLKKQGKKIMKFHDNIITLTQQNNNYHQEIATAQYSQVVLMNIRPQEEIGEEVHPNTDQLLVFVSGTGKAILNGETSSINPGDLILVPAGTRHNIINAGIENLKLYTIYTPPHHKPGTVHTTKAEE